MTTKKLDILKSILIFCFLTIYISVCFNQKAHFAFGNYSYELDKCKTNDAQFLIADISPNNNVHFEKSIEHKNPLNSLLKKVGFNDFIELEFDSKNHFEDKCGSYLIYSNNLLIRFRKSDFIFPHHYHW